MDDEEVDRNYAASLQRHETIYQEKAKNIREVHDAWLGDREASSNRVRSALERRRDLAIEENVKDRLANDLIAAHKSRCLATKNDVQNFLRNWVLDNCPIIFDTAHISKKTLSAISLSPKRKRREDGEEEDEEEAYSRWAELWIHSCVVELTDEQAFRAATRDISFLSQIGVTFDFSSTSNLDEDLRRNEEERANTVPD